jgi:CRP/FNR family transcriptional regulator, dissimilatory nitrate respiration regulator
MRPAAPSPHSLLAALALFKSLDRATLERLSFATVRLVVKRGERVFSKGDPVRGMYVLVYGQVRLMASGSRGRRLTSVVQPGGSFAEPMMFLGQPAIVDAEAASDALLLLVPKEAIFDELDGNPLFARRMIAALCERIQALVHEADRQAIPEGRQRLIQYLARNARGHDPDAVVELPGPKALVAAHLHLTPEHFSRILHELASEGLVRVRARRIEVPVLARLVQAGSKRVPPSPNEKTPQSGACSRGRRTSGVR